MTAYQYDKYADEFRRRAGPLWQAAIDYSLGTSSKRPVCPYQVEIHLHSENSPLCLLRCVDCHGRFQRVRGGMRKALWLKLIDDLAGMDVPSLVISGAYSDPTTDESLLISVLKQQPKKYGIKLHTYGLSLTPRLQRAIRQAASIGPDGESYVTLSKVTRGATAYQAMCRPIKHTPDEALQLEEKRIASLTQMAADSNLVVRLNCRLTKINSDPFQIRDLLRWMFGVSSLLFIRFTTDYIPTLAPANYRAHFVRDIYLPPQAASELIEQAIDGLGLTEEERKRVSFRNPEQLSYCGDRCFNGLLFSCVSAAGGVFPCQGIASQCFAHLSYGTLQKKRFPALWRAFVANWRGLPRYECPRCVGDCESHINSALEKEATHGSLPEA